MSNRRENKRSNLFGVIKAPVAFCSGWPCGFGTPQVLSIRLRASSMSREMLDAAFVPFDSLQDRIASGGGFRTEVCRENSAPHHFGFPLNSAIFDSGEIESRSNGSASVCNCNGRSWQGRIASKSFDLRSQ